MNRTWVGAFLVTGLAAFAAAQPQYPLSALDYRAEREFQSLRQALAERTEQEFLEALEVFLERYGYASALAGLYVEWAEKQTKVKNAAVLYGEILHRWPERPEAQKAVLELSEVMLLTEPWAFDKQLAALREFSQRVIGKHGETPEASVLTAMAKAFLAASEPNQARACITAALSSTQENENVDLYLLRAESYRVAGNSAKAAEMFWELMEQPLSPRRKQAAASGFLSCISPVDTRFDAAMEQLRDADPDSLITQSFQ